MSQLIRPSARAYFKRLILSLITCCVATPAALSQVVVAPTVTSSGNTFDCPQTITMTAPAGNIYYTTNGANASQFSTHYLAPVPFFGNCQIHAVAFSGSVLSDQTVFNLELDPSLPAPIYWLESNAGVTSTVGNPGNVLLWADQSGSGTSATAQNGTSSPNIFQNAVNGLPSISFNGSQYMTLPTAYGPFFHPIDLNIFIVTKPTVLTPNAHLLDLGDGANGNDISIQIESGATPYVQFSIYAGTTSSNSVDSSPYTLAANKYQIVEVRGNSSLSTVYLNGIPGATTNAIPVTSAVRHFNFIGQSSNAGNTFSGAIPEVIIFSTLTPSQCAAVEGMLLRKYQIPTQPSLSPQFSVPGGTLMQPSEVVLSAPKGMAIYYTISTTGSGITPTMSSIPYSGTPIPVNYSQIIEAICVQNGIQVGSTAVAKYSLDSGLWPVPSSSDTTAPTTTILLPTPSVP